MSLPAALYYIDYWTNHFERYDPVQFEDAVMSLIDSDLESLHKRIQKAFIHLRHHHDQNEIWFQRYHKLGIASLQLLGIAIYGGWALHSWGLRGRQIKDFGNFRDSVPLFNLVALIAYPFLLLAIFQCRGIEKNLIDYNMKLANASGMKEQIQLTRISRGEKKFGFDDLQTAGSSDSGLN